MADLLELLIDHKEGIPLVMYKQFLAPHPIYTASVVVTVVAEVRWDWHPKMSYCNHQTGRVCHLLKENQGMVDPVLGCFWCKILSKTFLGFRLFNHWCFDFLGSFQNNMRPVGIEATQRHPGISFMAGCMLATRGHKQQLQTLASAQAHLT